MKKLIYTLLILSFVCSCSHSQRYAKDNLPLPVKGHPRVMVTGKTVGELRERFNDPRLAGVREELYRQAYGTDSGIVNDGDPKEYIWRAYECRAFLYLINGDREAGLQAKDMVLELFSSIAPDLVPGKDGMAMWPSRRTSEAIFGAALVYDWCYDLFTKAEKRQLISDVNRLAGLMEAKELGPWPHLPENMIMSDFVNPHWTEMKHPHLMAFGIACYDEWPDLYLNMADHLYNWFVPARNYFYKGKKHPQGSAYGMTPRLLAELLSKALITRMGYPNPYDERQGELPMFSLYTRRPDGHLMVEGDDYIIFRKPDFYQGIETLLLASDEYDNGYYLQEALQYWEQFQYYTEYNDPVFIFLTYDTKLEPKKADDLPLSRYFPSPAGTMVARTGWDITGGAQSDVAIAKMDIHDHNTGGHAHCDAGNFTIYYKGPLAIDSGAYTFAPDNRKWGSSHFNNYLVRTVAHNTLLISNGNNPAGEQKDKPGRAGTLEEMDRNSLRGEVLGYGFGPDPVRPEFTWMKGDIAKAYDSSVQEMKRSFVFLNTGKEEIPAYLIIKDHFKGEEPSTIKWLLHSEQEPLVRDRTITVTKDRGRDNYGGQLIAKTVTSSADNLNYEKIGGPGKEFWNNGQNWPLRDPAHIDTFEAGRWRIELSNDKPAKELDLLNIIQIGDISGSAEDIPVEMMDGTAVQGVRIMDRAVFFSQDSNELHKGFDFKINGKTEETISILMTDLKAGKWKLTGPAEKEFEVQSGKGCIHFVGKTGNWHIAPIE